MEESGGKERKDSEEISLLVEELIQLSVRRSMVVSNVKLSLICSVWTKKSVNLEIFRAQLKSIWKTKKNFEIQLVGQNLFLIAFDLKKDLEAVMEGCPWLFHKNLILFEGLSRLTERDQIRLVSLPFWIKIGSCPPEFDKNGLLHAIGGTFGGIIRSEISGDICRLRINLNVQKPLRRGIFVSSDNIVKVWISFKYEKFSIFYFGYGRMGHGLNDCLVISPTEKNKIRDDPPYTIALKAESNLVERESIKFNAYVKKLVSQCSYMGVADQELISSRKNEEFIFK
ncbi:hypothetical protein J1N35_010083 [Gossypium stocksii]|uniref:DUF4283 domain-containing protein n=1 Tax=Gossypium stocksii TaxID=47602 RepID=A0A9D3W1P1_9ROSI|nr:hypothetical protein J1N35_010083 [Gossypium stocksii]